MKKIEKLALWLLFTLGFCGCASSHSAEADLRATLQTQETLAEVTHSETKIAEHGGAFRIYRWHFRRQGQPEGGAAHVPYIPTPGSGSDSVAPAVPDTGLSEYEVEVHDGVDKTFMGSSEGQLGLEVQSSGAVAAHEESASSYRFGWPWWLWLLIICAVPAAALFAWHRFLRPWLILAGLIK